MKRLLSALALGLLIGAPAHAGDSPTVIPSAPRAVKTEYSEADQLVFTMTITQIAVTDRTVTKFFDTASDAKAGRAVYVQVDSDSSTVFADIAFSQTRAGDAGVKTAGEIRQGNFLRVRGGSAPVLIPNLYLRSSLGTSLWIQSSHNEVGVRVGIAVRAEQVLY